MSPRLRNPLKSSQWTLIRSLTYLRFQTSCKMLNTWWMISSIRQTSWYRIPPSISNSHPLFLKRTKMSVSHIASRNSNPMIPDTRQRHSQGEEAQIMNQWIPPWCNHIRWRHLPETQARYKAQWARASLPRRAATQFLLHILSMEAMQPKMPLGKESKMRKHPQKATQDLTLPIVCQWFRIMFTNNNNKWLISQLQTKKSLNLI